MLNIHILSIFPESFSSILNTSILKKAQEKNLLNIELYKLNNYSNKNTKRVDARPYWWWAWQIIQIEPIYKAIKDIISKSNNKLKFKIINFRPQWKLLKQKICEKYAQDSNKYNYLLVCWHYEAIDERFYEMFNPDEISIWEYILSGWELPAMIFIDSIIRLIPWVLWNSHSLSEESFSEALDWKLEYPHYSRPRNFKWYEVPTELLSGNAKIIKKFKQNKTK